MRRGPPRANQDDHPPPGKARRTPATRQLRPQAPQTKRIPPLGKVGYNRQRRHRRRPTTPGDRHRHSPVSTEIAGTRTHLHTQTRPNQQPSDRGRRRSAYKRRTAQPPPRPASRANAVGQRLATTATALRMRPAKPRPSSTGRRQQPYAAPPRSPPPQTNWHGLSAVNPTLPPLTSPPRPPHLDHRDRAAHESLTANTQRRD
jgi:hypothetical protein